MIWAMFFLGFDHVPILDLGFVTYQSVGFGAGALFLTFLWWKHDEYLAFLNLLISGGVNGGKQDGNNDDMFSRLIPWIIPAVYMQSFCNSFLFVRRRNGVQYIWSLLHPSWQNCKTFALITCYEFLIPMNTWNIVLFMFYTYSSYTHYLGVHLKKWANLQRRHPPVSVKACQRCTLSYRQMQIMTNMYHSCYSKYLVPAGLTFLLFLVSWMTFATLRLAKSPLVSVSQPSFLIFPLGTFALFILSFCVNSEGLLLFQGSTQLLWEWKRCRIMKRMKILQSFEPIKAQVGSLYYLKRTSPLIFTSNVVGLTINLLLTF
ncbi:uncharacterized protein LOC118435729 [Folsomia candida]|nr:uncharacterized protein LOC118435729 [Folsomia candida]